MELGKVRKLSFEDLQQYTDCFSEDNYIGEFQFGKVYRGKIELATDGIQEVTVKIWEQFGIYQYREGDNKNRLRDEVFLLQHDMVKSHPNLVKLIGYCCEDEQHLGVVYDLKPLDTLENLILKDDFTWPQRIKVAVGFARLLEFLHTENSRYLSFLVRNIDAAHIMLDQDHNPKLYDFSMICGGVLPDWSDIKNQIVWGTYGYIDQNLVGRGEWTLQRDVFAFGVVLLYMITKRIYTEEERLARAPLVYEWAWDVYKPNKSIFGYDRSQCSLVHKSFETDPAFHPSDGIKITRLTMRCIKYHAYKRPLMKVVVKGLLGLSIVQHQAGVLGIDGMIHRQGTILQKLKPFSCFILPSNAKPECEEAVASPLH